MKMIELTYPHALQFNELPETVAAIGFFDGIHKGHQKVIKTATEYAKQNGMESAVITFHPHPSVVLKKDKKEVRYITPLREKRLILEQIGVDRLYVITFNKELSMLSPQEFIDHFIIGLHIKHLVAGFDYSFGHMGKGNMRMIGELTRDKFTYTTIDKVTRNDEKISSTKIRELLQLGNIAAVNLLLGRKLALYGTVVKGKQRGRDLGYPTANFHLNDDFLLPKPGIYAVKVIFQDKSYLGMASLGYNPTFTADRTDLSLEVNILDYSGDLYGEELRLEWYTFIRDEVKFANAEELIKQIENDEKVIRNYFATSS